MSNVLLKYPVLELTLGAETLDPALTPFGEDRRRGSSGLWVCVKPTVPCLWWLSGAPAVPLPRASKALKKSTRVSEPSPASLPSAVAE